MSAAAPARDASGAGPADEGAPKVRIGLGTSTLPFESPRRFFEWVDLCEGCDVDSLWQTDRLVSRQPHLEAVASMAALAGATERMRFGFNAVVASLRDPLLLAKQCATIDWLSGGRLLPVFGVGNERAPEWRATGTSPKGRGARADEALELLRRLWSEESVSFEGEHYRYREASISPRPVQAELPLWIGGHSRAAIRRTARIGTGWLAGIQTPGEVAEIVPAIHRALAETGRRIDADHYGAGFPFRFGSWDDPELPRSLAAAAREPRRYAAVGDAAAILRRIEEYRAAGISKFVLIPVASGDDDLMTQTRRLVEEVLPVVHAPAG